ncbi:MAG: dihydroorotase [Saprospiraceae bacterium]|nr:dihydroorotase [Saprospiraceae bacterium]
MKTIIRNGRIVNEGEIFIGDILIENQRIKKIAPQIFEAAPHEIDATDKFILPGIIDDQVHFREPGLTHKASIFTEARAAVAGGVTSFMEMPNTKPPASTQALLQQKYDIAAQYSLSNFSFFMGATNDNLDEVLKTDGERVCGIKVFMGSSTGNMLVDNTNTLEKLFSSTPLLIATHCEDETTILKRQQQYAQQANDASYHPIIRNEEACYKSSSLAVALAKKWGTRLHILHISTADELPLFDNTIPLEQKKITAEVCVHHLHFTANDYALLGNKIKCNPAIKAMHHAPELWKALKNNTLDIIATDHAPHTAEEKALPYQQAPSGLPLVQHSLQLMYQYVTTGTFAIEKLVEKMCHAPAVCFRLQERGFLREGYFADVVLFNPNEQELIRQEAIFYKCKWSPLTGKTMHGTVEKVWVNGHLAYNSGQFDASQKGQRLRFSC